MRKIITIISLFFIFSNTYAKYKVLHVLGGDLDNISGYINQVDYSINKFKTDTNVEFISVKYWDLFLKHAPTADFIIYTGHGNTNITFSLKTKTILREQTLNEVKLKPNCIIIYSSVCTSTGSTAGDTSKVSIELAKKRVLSHANMWFKLGASAYYADATPDFSNVLEYINNKKSMVEIFISDNIRQYLKIPNYPNTTSKDIIHNIKVDIHNEPSTIVFVESYDKNLKQKENFFTSVAIFKNDIE